MKVAHVTFSKKSGPGYIARKFRNFLESAKVSNHFYFIVDNDARNYFRLDIWKLILVIFDLIVVKKLKNKSLFSLYRLKNFDLSFFKLDHFQVIFLYWVTGVVNTLEPIKTEKKLIWRLSDMEPFTGGCHYSNGCMNFKSNCNNCPSVRKFFQKKVKNNFIKKQKFFNNLNVTFIAPSKWIKNCAEESKLIGNKEILYIPNPCNTEVFYPVERLKKDHNFNIGFVAKNLKDSQKNIQNTADFLMEKFKTHKNAPEFTFVGNNKIFFKKYNFFKINYYPYTINQFELNKIYNKFDVFISPSIYDNSPSTVIESQSAGVPVLCAINGGQKEYVEHGITGFHFESNEDLFYLLKILMNDSILLNNMKIESRKLILNNFSDEIIAKRLNTSLGL